MNPVAMSLFQLIDLFWQIKMAFSGGDFIQGLEVVKLKILQKDLTFQSDFNQIADLNVSQTEEARDQASNPEYIERCNKTIANYRLVQSHFNWICQRGVN